MKTELKETKKCTICLQELEISNFYIQFIKNSNKNIIKEYIRPACKNCANRNQLKYSNAWKEKVGYNKQLNKERLNRRVIDIEWRNKIKRQGARRAKQTA